MMKSTRIVAMSISCLALSPFLSTVMADTITIATVENGDMVRMQALTEHYAKDNPDITIEWVTLDENTLRQRATTDIATGTNNCEASGFEWIDCTDNEHSVIAFVRWAKAHKGCVVIICNFTPRVHEGYRIGVPEPGNYQERINSDSSDYAGSGVGNLGGVSAEAIGSYGRSYSLTLTLPPLAAIVFQKIPAPSP